MNEGPTTVGSIVGKMRMDRDEWIVAVAATKQDIRELEASDPNIHVDATVGEAVAKLAAVEAAQKKVSDRTDSVSAAQARLSAAMRAADTAYARANIAQMRLNELRDKGVTDGARLASAELTLSEAMHRLDSANEKATASELALAAAQRTAAAAATENAAAQDNAARETVKANEANRTSVTRIGAIVTAVALLVPLLAPVGAAAIGIGSAFLGMGAAGVFALVGIKREMEDGTKAGAAYSDGVNDMKDMLDQLSRTSAVNMLGSFQRVVRHMRDDMPFLNTQIGQFSLITGRTGAGLFVGALNSLRVLNPLLLTAGLYVQSLAQGFERWTRGQGIQDFGGYALSMLPTVTDLLGKLASMVMHILEALAPLGTVGMAVLSVIADGINAIPVEILSQLIVSITWGAIAFKAWGFIAPMLATVATSMGAVGAATTIATGPIGWVVAGLSALAGIFAIVMASNSGATQAMQDYTVAVQADSGAIGENIRQKAAQKLLDSGALDAAKKLGISLSTVTDATLGNADALKELSQYTAAANGDQAALAEISKESGLQAIMAAKNIQILTEGISSNSTAIAGEIDRYNVLQGALLGTTSATRAQQQADEAVAAALGISTSAVADARSGQRDLKAETEKATAEMYLQGDAAGLLKQELDLLNGKTLSAADAQNRFDSTLANMGAHIDKTGKDINRATADLEGMSAAAVANRGELISSVEAAQASAQAFRDNGGSADETRQKLLDMREAIIQHAISVGEDEGQVRKLIDTIFQVPESVPPTKLEVDTANAIAQTQSFLSWVSQRVATINVRANLPDLNGDVSGSGRMGSFANGGTIPGLAGGGTGGTVFGPGNAHSDTAGLFRLANGEEITSNRFGQADRNRALLKQINAGFTPVMQQLSVASPTPVKEQTIVQKFYVTGVQQEDPRVLGMIVGGEVGRALVGFKK